MKNKYSIVISIIFSILYFSGCTSVKTVVVDIEKPAQIILPKSIENIGIVNNAALEVKPEIYKNDRSAKDVDKTHEEMNISSDSICFLFTKTMFEELTKLDRFENISLYEYPLREDITKNKVQAIDTTTIKDLSTLLNADVILSLDHLQVSTIYEEKPYEYDYKLKSLFLNIDVSFSFYSKDGGIMSEPLYLSDSVYWEALYTRNGKTLLTDDSIPNRGEAIEQATNYVSEKIAKSFVPKWISQVRMYYGDIKEANNEIANNNWEKALNLWKEAFAIEQKNKKKARLANNIAVAYELSDNISQALEWSQTSIVLFTESIETDVDRNNLALAQLYQQELIKRSEDFTLFEKTETTNN